MIQRHVYAPVTEDYESDPGTIQFHDSHIDERDEPGYLSFFEGPCRDAEATIECGVGDAASANRYHGTQEGGLRSPIEDAFKLGGW